MGGALTFVAPAVDVHGGYNELLFRLKSFKHCLHAARRRKRVWTQLVWEAKHVVWMATVQWRLHEVSVRVCLDDEPESSYYYILLPLLLCSASGHRNAPGKLTARRAGDVSGFALRKKQGLLS